MAERSIEVRLRMNATQYQVAVAKASASTRELAGATRQMAVDGDKNFQTLSRAVGIAGIAVAAGFTKMVSTAASFDKQMSQVAAVANTSAHQLQQLRDAAIEAGAATAFSASEAAKAQEELVKAGISVQDILGGALAGSLDLAAAGSLDLGQAAEIAAQAMNIFGLAGSDVTHIADLLAAGANKSAADVAQLGDAMRQGGLVAAQTGLSIEETVGALSAFADNALIGSDAGTSLKSMLQRLTPQSAEAAGLMEDLGFSAYDAAGNFIGLEGLAQELTDSLGGMTTQQRNATMATLFGTDAVRAANIIYTQGADGIADYVEAVDDQGAAADMAAAKLDNLAGDLEELGGSIETVLIKNGTGATTVLRGLTQGATGAVNAFGDLPAPIQAGAVGLTGLLGAAGLAIGALGIMAPKVREARRALDNMGAAGQWTSRHMGSFARGVGAASLALTAMTAAGQVLNATMYRLDEADLSKLENSLLNLAENGRLGGEAAAVLGEDMDALARAVERVADPSVATQLQHVGNEVTTLFGVLGRGGAGPDQAAQTIDDLDKALASLAGVDADAAAGALEQIKDALGPETFEALLPLLDDYESALAGLDTAARTTGGALAGTTEIVADQEQAAKDLQETLDQLSDAFDVVSANLSAESAAIAAAQAFDDLNETMADTETTLDLATEAGQTNRGALEAAAGAAMRHAQAMSEQGASADTVSFYLNTYRDRLAETMRAAGFAEDEIANYIATLGFTPQNISTIVDLLGVSQAEAEIETLTRDRAVNVRLQVSEAISGAVRNLAGRVVGRHAGGPVPGTGNTDSVPALLTPGEFVVRKEAVQALGLGTLWRLNAAHFATGGLAGLTGAVLSGPLGGLWRRDQTAERLKGTAAGQRVIAGARDDDGKVDVGKAMADLRNLADTYLEVADAAGTAAAEQLAAHEHLSSTDFDRVAGEIVETAEALREMAEEAAETRRKVQDVRFEIGELGTDEYLSILRDRLAGEERYSDEWLDIWTEIDSIESDLVDARKERLDDLADVQEDAFDKLVDLLNQQADIQAKIEQTTAAHHAKLRDLERSLADDQTAAIRDRADALSSWASIEERSVIRWGNTVGALTANVRDQVDQFAEWQDALNRARGRGVSEAVVDMLGLAEGPQALGQLRMFMSASEEEIAALNAAVGQRQAQAGEQAQRESTQAYSELGRQLADMQARFAAEVEELNEEFLAEQRSMTEELASLGQDQGRSYGEAVAEGLASQIPAVQAAAQALRAAMAGLDAARNAPAASGGSGTLINTETGRAAVTGPAGEGAFAPGDPRIKTTPGLKSWTMPDGRTAYYVPGQKIQAGNLGALRGYAMGSPFVPSDGPAFLHRGERVFSASDNSALVRAVQQIGAAPAVNVVAEVYVDGQRMVDDRIRVVLRDNRTGTAIAGSR